MLMLEQSCLPLIRRKEGDPSHPSASISIIVATYNRDRSLVACLESVINQDWDGQTEIIVVDQTLKHPQEVLDFLWKHRRKITRIEHREPNLPKARNAGVAAARGDYLLFVDDDIILPAYAVRRLAEHFREPQPKGVTGLVVSESNAEESLRAYARRFGVLSMDKVQVPLKVAGFIGALMMVSANAVKAAGGFDPRLGRLTPTAYGEDNDFCWRLRRAGVPLWIDPTVRAIHNDHLAGGCGSRRTDPELASKYHMKSTVYIRIKNHGRMGAQGWLQLLRGFVVNSDILRQRPGLLFRNFATAWSAVKEVRAFMGAGGTRGRMGWGILRSWICGGQSQR